MIIFFIIEIIWETIIILKRFEKFTTVDFS